MKFSITDDHLFHFKDEGFIEFEGLVSESELATIEEAIDDVVARQQLKSSQRTAQGLWRHSSEIWSLISHRRFGEVATQLLDQTHFRIGLDLYLPKGDLFNTPKSLEQLCPLQGILCGWILCIEPTTDEESFLPKTPGHVLYVSPSKLLDFSHNTGTYYLVALTTANSLFILNRESSFLKHFLELGYNYGDRLTDDKNPIIYK